MSEGSLFHFKVFLLMESLGRMRVNHCEILAEAKMSAILKSKMAAILKSKMAATG